MNPYELFSNTEAYQCFTPWFQAEGDSAPSLLVAALYKVDALRLLDVDFSAGGRVPVEVSYPPPELRRDSRFAPIAQGADPAALETYRSAMYAAIVMWLGEVDRHGMTYSVERGKVHRFPLTDDFRMTMLRLQILHVQGTLRFPVAVGPDAANRMVVIRSAAEWHELAGAFHNASLVRTSVTLKGGMLSLCEQVGRAKTKGELDQIVMELPT